MSKILGLIVLLSLCAVASTVAAEVTVQQRVDEKTGASVVTVANGMYRVEWVQSKGRTPTIPRAWAGDNVPVGSLFDVSWGRVESGELQVIESGPLRVVLAGELRVLREGDEATVDILRMRAEHWANDPRIAIACDFDLGKDYPNKWILCHNFLRLGGDVSHVDRWAAGGDPPNEGQLDPLPTGPVAEGKRWFFFNYRPWGEIYRPDPPEKSVGVGAFSDGHGMWGEHYCILS